MLIHIHRNGQNYGPYSLEELREYLASGHVARHDLAWYEGAEQWLPIDKTPALAAVLHAAFAPSPAAPRAAQAADGLPSFLAMETQAGFWRRSVAWLIDQLVVVGALWIVFLLILFIDHRRYIESQPLWAAALGILAPWLYFALQESGPAQATLGKRLLGIQVTDAQGLPIGLGRASARYFAKALSWLVLGIGFIMAGFTAHKQALHDLVAGTQVRRRVTALSRPGAPALE